MAQFDMQQVIEHYNSITKEFKIDLAEEFVGGRIRGTEYADTYQKLMAQSMQEAFQTPLMAAQIEQMLLQNEKLELEKQLLECEIAKCEATTAQILSATTIQEAQSDKDLLIKAEQINNLVKEGALLDARTDGTLSDTQIKEAQSAKDLLYKDAQINDTKAATSVKVAQEDGIKTDTHIKDEHLPKDLSLKDKELEIKEAQKNHTVRQTAGFDDNANQKLFDAQMNSWALAFSAGMLESMPSIITDNSATELYNLIKKP